MKSAVNSGFSTPYPPGFEELVYIVETKLPLPNPSTLWTGHPRPEGNGHIFTGHLLFCMEFPSACSRTLRKMGTVALISSSCPSWPLPTLEELPNSLSRHENSDSQRETEKGQGQSGAQLKLTEMPRRPQQNQLGQQGMWAADEVEGLPGRHRLKKGGRG